MNKDNSFKRDGYLNVTTKTNGMYSRKSKSQISNLENELLIYKKLGIETTYENNTIKREWFDGDVVQVFNEEMTVSLKEEITKFHNLPQEGLSKHDWFKYKNESFVSHDIYEKYKALVEKHKDDKLVVSHNDINKENVLWDGKTIRLIDFEWGNINHEYFDYVQFFITESINLLKDYDQQTFADMNFMVLVYFILWTYSIPKHEYISKLRSRYVKALFATL